MTQDPVRWLWAAVLIGLWLLLIAAVAATRVWAGRLTQARAILLAQGAEPVVVAFASQTGAAEQFAWMTAEALSRSGTPTRVASLGDMDPDALVESSRVLIVASTTGEGDAPDSLSGFCRRYMAQPAELDGLAYGLLALGDRSYAGFCGFGRALDDWLQLSGAVPLFERVEVDDGDPAAVAAWQSRLQRQFAEDIDGDWAAPALSPWRLAERTHLNPGSPGGEAYLLAFEFIGSRPGWAAGDIAEIAMPNSDQHAREYSLASLPEDGRAEFIVRRMRRPDGALGIASGLLTRDLDIGESIDARIRRNSAFHGPAPETPVILIGNGTGLAGLRAHWRERAAHRNRGKTWLMFGERTIRHDAFLNDELQAALVSGDLVRIDRTYSRDEDDGRYVQALIIRHAADVRDWIGEGAAILVCGGADGMAQGVETALEDALGAAGLDVLKDSGRYRRDVY